MKNAKTPSKEHHLANGASAINGKKLVRRGPSPMALEQRFMFDGAALADATQTVATADAAASHDVAVADSHQTDTTTAATATATAVPAAPPAPELMHVVANTQEAPAALAQARADAERLISAFLQQPDARAQLFELFHGSQSQPSAEWLQAADSFLAAFRDGAAPVQVELRSHAEMQGAMAAFAAHGPDGQPVIYLNGDWARQVATPEGLTRVLLEEYGHRIDASLNGDIDTAGDEGEAFAQRALGITPDADQAARIAAEDDHDMLQIDGRTVEVEQAAITFSVVYQGRPSSWSEEAQNLVLYASPFNGSNYRFTSSNPSDLYFQGNNVTGTLSYQDQSGNRQEIYGVVSRLFKTGNTIDGFYFYSPGADGVINGIGDSAYLLALTPTKFTGSTSYGTSSDPVDTALNGFIVPNSAPVAVNDSASVREDGSVSGNLLTNDSDANGDTLRVAQFSVSGQTYTLALGGSSTVPLGSAGSLTVGSDGSYSFTPVANYAGAVPLVTYTVTDGTASASASLSVSIVSVNDAPDGADKTINTREDTPYVFSAADFGFTDRNDTPANVLEAVKISSLPTEGTLLFNGMAITPLDVSNGYFVAVADIGKLSFRPLANQAATASFTFQVKDDGGTVNGGINLDPVANTITFAISNATHAPVAADDIASAAEAGGTGNATPGYDATGNVLANDTDVDSPASSLTVTAVRLGGVEGSGTAGIVGSAFQGSYGTLTLQADGSYSYAVENNNATVNALAAGASLVEQFNYTVSDGSLSDMAVLAITINGANDAPVNTVLASHVQYDYQQAVISSLSVHDVDGNLAAGNTVTLSVGQGSLLVVRSGSAVASGSGTADSPLVLSGSESDINATLATLRYQPAANHSGQDILKMVTLDSQGLSDIDFTSITVQPDNRALAVNDVLVNEGSPYAVFTVSGQTGQLVKLAIANGSATGGSDFSANLEYYNGSAWAAYTSAAVAIPGSSGASTLLVRAAVLNDQTYEGAETFTLTASNVAAVGATGTATIVDDGRGYVYGDSATGAIDAQATRDDDRPLTVSNVEVNEASPYAMFKVGGASDQIVTLTLANGNASDSDHGTRLQYLSGASWLDYNGPVAMPGAEMLVRVFIMQDSVYEGRETFNLSGTNTGGLSARGEAAIYDNGMGNIYLGTNTTGGRDTSGTGFPAALDDDRELSVQSVRVNEASDYAVFTISGTAGQFISLNVVDGSATIAQGQELQVWNGTSWTNYASAVLPQIGADGHLLVRVNIVAEQDTTYESEEDFRLQATLSPANGSAVREGTGIIVDDGTGKRFGNDVSGGLPQLIATGLDDDRLLGVSDVTVSETSPYVIFTVSGSSGQVLNLALQATGNGAGFATPGTDTGAALQYWTGATWADYDGSVTMRGNNLLVRVAINQDGDYEGPETFRLLATNSSGKASTGGTGTISDDGSSNVVFRENDTTPQTGIADDDRVLSISNVTVSEASPYIVFTVSGTPDQVLNLSLQTTGNGPHFATPGTDTGSTLQYWTGATWADYNGSVTMRGNNLLVRVAINQDSDYEGPETFRLLATNSSGKTSTGGTGTIRDDGGSTTVFNETDITPQTGSLDDDRALAISDVTVSEASPYIVFTVSGTPGQTLALSLQTMGSGAGFATPGTDTGSTLQYFNGSAWVSYGGSVTMTGNSLLVRVAVTQDSVYEGPETFRLLATNSSGKASTGGTGTIRDDGAVNIVFGDTDTIPQEGAFDDDRLLTVSDLTISEASPHAVFRVTGVAGQKVTLALESGTATVGTDTGTALQYFDGAAWRDYTPGSLVAIPQGGNTLLVRVAIVNDSVFEGGESFRLISRNRNGEAGVGTATLKDDGSSREVYLESNTDGRPTTGEADDDQSRPQAVVQPVAPAPAAPAPVPVPEAPAPQQAAPFNSTLVLTEATRAPDALRSEPVGDLITSGAGFQIPVVEGDAARLSTYRSVADQFVEGNRSVTFTLPYDAFVHTRAEATVVLAATLTDGQSLPAWIRFDARTGSFSLNPPPDFAGEMEVKVIARDNEGREAATVFRLFVGEDKVQLPARSSLSEQIRLAGKRSSPFAALVRGQEPQGQRQQPGRVGSKV